jgi:hypothetical protein
MPKKPRGFWTGQIKNHNFSHWTLTKMSDVWLDWMIWMDSQASLTISQTILFNFKTSTSSATKYRHFSGREPPLPLFIGIKIHTEMRSKKIINQLHDLGLSVSYTRVLQLESWLATAVCENFQEKGVVVPTQMKRGLFTASALDNLDHNPSSTTASGSFHGTGISMFQFLISSNLGEKQNAIRLALADTKKNHQLPDSFATVASCSIENGNSVSSSTVQCVITKSRRAGRRPFEGEVLAEPCYSTIGET